MSINDRKHDEEERRQRVLYRAEKKRLSNETNLVDEYKYDGEDGIDDDMLSQIQRFLR